MEGSGRPKEILCVRWYVWVYICGCICGFCTPFFLSFIFLVLCKTLFDNELLTGGVIDQEKRWGMRVLVFHCGECMLRSMCVQYMESKDKANGWVRGAKGVFLFREESEIYDPSVDVRLTL